jgi:hypothetical protein
VLQAHVEGNGMLARLSQRSRLLAKLSIAVGVFVVGFSEKSANAQWGNCQWYDCVDDGVFGTHCGPGFQIKSDYCMGMSNPGGGCFYFPCS